MVSSLGARTVLLLNAFAELEQQQQTKLVQCLLIKVETHKWGWGRVDNT